MQVEFVPYEIALELKELGFNRKCFSFYWTTKSLKHYKHLESGLRGEVRFDYFNNVNRISAPLWQQAFDFFRDKGIYSSLDKLEDGYCVYVYIDADGRDNILFDLLDEDKRKLHVFSTYEEARLKCLEKLIELL